MAKLSLSTIPLLLFILTLTTLTPPTTAAFSRPISKADVGLDNEQLTHLTFYWHDVVSGPNPTALEIAKSTITDNSTTSFGRLTMIDDLLTEGPEATSKQVGRAQGMYLASDLKFNALGMIMNFAFMEGEYNGSTLSVLGRDPVLESVREMPVIGGTGKFRFAKGYAQLRTEMFNQKTGDAVVKYDVYVSHADSTSDTPGSGGSGSGSKSSAAALGQISLSKMASILLIISCILISI